MLNYREILKIEIGCDALFNGVVIVLVLDARFVSKTRAMVAPSF